MTDCLFCRIVGQEIQARIVMENDEIITFHDLNPQAPVHVLIVPRKHIKSLGEALDDDGNLLGKIQLFARDIAKSLGLTNGFRLVMNNGKGVGQSVDHLHYHLLAGRRMQWPPG